MKNTVLFMLFIFPLLTLLSCNKDDKSMQLKENMSAKVNGQPFTANSFVVARSGKSTSINGTLGPVTNPVSIGLSIDGIKVGIFTLNENAENFAVYNSSTDEYISTTGSIEIKVISGEWMEGEFTFTAQSIHEPAQQIQISDGKFRMKFD